VRGRASRAGKVSRSRSGLIYDLKGKMETADFTD
jgi:hypothetical protein